MAKAPAYGVHDIIERELAVKTMPVVNPVTDTVQTTVTQILRNDPNRLLWLLINLSGFTFYFGFDREVSAARGIPVSPNGGFAQLTWREDSALVAYDVYAISPSGAAKIYLVAVVLRT